MNIDLVAVWDRGVRDEQNGTIETATNTWLRQIAGAPEVPAYSVNDAVLNVAVRAVYDAGRRYARDGLR